MDPDGIGMGSSGSSDLAEMRGKKGIDRVFLQKKAPIYKVNCVSLQCEECVVFATNCP